MIFVLSVCVCVCGGGGVRKGVVYNLQGGGGEGVV